MKRFHCQTCDRTVRVRKLPLDVKPITDLTGKITGYTPGNCRHHTDLRPRSVVNGRAKTKHVNVSKKKLSATSQKSKSKK